MSAELALIVPTRGRPQSAARLIRAVRETAAGNPDLYFALDDDDPSLGEYWDVFNDLGFTGEICTGPRQGLTAWTNQLALPLAFTYEFLASFGDDHVPVTEAWDVMLTDAIRAMLGEVGYSYPNDGVRPDVPEAVVMSSAIVRALGWMALPSLRHFCIDHVWLHMGIEAGCLEYLPDVRVDHLHHTVGKSPKDETYTQAIHDGSEDIHAYGRWREKGAAQDISTLLMLIRERS